MPKSRQTPVEAFRQRQKRQGIVRLEVRVRKDDAALLRSIAQALGDPGREAEVRSLLRARFVAPPPIGLKAILSSVPLDGIELERPRDVGRPVDL